MLAGGLKGYSEGLFRAHSSPSGMGQFDFKDLHQKNHTKTLDTGRYEFALDPCLSIPLPPPPSRRVRVCAMVRGPTVPPKMVRPSAPVPPSGGGGGGCTTATLPHSGILPPTPPMGPAPRCRCCWTSPPRGPATSLTAASSTSASCVPPAPPPLPHSLTARRTPDSPLPSLTAAFGQPVTLSACSP